MYSVCVYIYTLYTLYIYIYIYNRRCPPTLRPRISTLWSGRCFRRCRRTKSRRRTGRRYLGWHYQGAPNKAMV